MQPEETETQVRVEYFGCLLNGSHLRDTDTGRQERAEVWGNPRGGEGKAVLAVGLWKRKALELQLPKQQEGSFLKTWILRACLQVFRVLLCVTMSSCEHPCGWVSWHTPITAALRRQRHMDLCQFEASLVYTESCKPARDPSLCPQTKQTFGVPKPSGDYKHSSRYSPGAALSGPKDRHLFPLELTLKRPPVTCTQKF